MWQFIISGNIPGTTIQINFDQVAVVIASIIGIMLISVLLREHRNYMKKIADLQSHADPFANAIIRKW